MFEASHSTIPQDPNPRDSRNLARAEIIRDIHRGLSGSPREIERALRRLISKPIGTPDSLFEPLVELALGGVSSGSGHRAPKRPSARTTIQTWSTIVLARYKERAITALLHYARLDDSSPPRRAAALRALAGITENSASLAQQYRDPLTALVRRLESSTDTSVAEAARALAKVVDS